MAYVDRQSIRPPGTTPMPGGASGGNTPGIGFQASGKKAMDLTNKLGKNDLANQNLKKRFKKSANNQIDTANATVDLTSGDLADQALAGANTAADYAGTTASGGMDLATNVFMPGAKNLYDLGMDPQNALYDRNLQRLREQQRVGQASRGIEMSPFGAGLENEALSNFNIDWENQALDRAIAGTNAAGTAAGTGFDLGNASSKLAASGALLPYSTQMGFLEDRKGAEGDKLGTMERMADYGTRANQTNQQQIGDYTALSGQVPAYKAANLAEDAQGFDQGMEVFKTITGLFGK